MPPSCRTKSRWNQQLEILWRRTSHFWSLIDVDIQPSPKDQPLHQRKFLGQQPANNSESPKAPSSSFTPKLYYIVLYTTLRTKLYSPNSTQLNSTQQTPTHHPVFSPQSTTRSTPSPLSRFNPKDLTSRRLADEPRTQIHLEIEESWEKKSLKLKMVNICVENCDLKILIEFKLNR